VLQTLPGESGVPNTSWSDGGASIMPGETSTPVTAAPASTAIRAAAPVPVATSKHASVGTQLRELDEPPQHRLERRIEDASVFICACPVDARVPFLGPHGAISQ